MVAFSAARGLENAALYMLHYLHEIKIVALP